MLGPGGWRQQDTASPQAMRQEKGPHRRAESATGLAVHVLVPLARQFTMFALDNQRGVNGLDLTAEA